MRERERMDQEARFLATFASESRRAEYKPQETPLVNDLEAYAKRFVRSADSFKEKTKTNNRNKRLRLLVRHVFVKYSPPKILEQAWDNLDPHAGMCQDLRVGNRGNNNQNINLQRIDFKDWYIGLAAGESFYKTRAKEWMTKQEAHWFTTCPHEVSLPQALYFAVSKATGVRDGVALRVARSKIAEKTFNDFWKETARFFSLPENHPKSVEQLNDLVDFVDAKRTETPTFRVVGQGYTLASLLKKMKDWHYELRRLKVLGNFSWEGHAIDDGSFPQKIDGQTFFWDFHQIKTSKELAAEGTAMHHCVFGYKQSCVSGNCSIWSLSLRNPKTNESKRKITIELRNDGRIVQKRGFANRAARAEENHMISLWARENGLVV